MRKINILYAITKLELGGAQKHCLSLITNLDKSKYNIFLFTAKEGLLLNDALAIDGLSVKASSFLERSLNPLKDFLALSEIYRFIKKNNIDVVHTHSSKAGILGRFAAKFAKAKVVLHTVHGWSFNDYQRFLTRYLYIWLERLAAQFSDRIIVVSDSDREKGLRNHIGNDNKYMLIRYGINLNEFSGNDRDIKEELGLNKHDLVVGMIACFKPQKSPLDFIKLAYLVNKTIADVKFILIGDGILRKGIERLILKLKLQKQVILLGWRNDIPAILSAIDIFVLTSLWEGLPITALEAMASFRPVVATDTGGISEIIQEGNTGFLVSPGDMNNMAQVLRMLLGDESLRRQIAQKARSSLNSNFTIDAMVRNTRDLYEDLIKRCADVYPAFAENHGRGVSLRKEL